MNQPASFTITEDGRQLTCQGAWTVQGLAELDFQLNSLLSQTDKQLTIDGSQLTIFDSAGAILLQQTIQQLTKHDYQISFNNFRKEHQTLLQLVKPQLEQITQATPTSIQHNFFYAVGETTVEKFQLGINFISFIGELLTTVSEVIIRPRLLQWKSALQTIEETGHQALPIIALLSFLIGVVLTYQVGLQLKIYGANIFIVELTGLAVLREFAPLMTAIIMAGRTTSAFTAQLGMMKVNEEIDALRTMGLSPMNRLVVPKIIGTLISTPLLTVWAMIFGVVGSMIMAQATLGVSYYDFFQRFQQDVPLADFVVGMVKTPVFALIVAGVGCFRGFEVKMSADSIGSQTTRSVVQAIFLLIVADALFSIYFSWRGI